MRWLKSNESYLLLNNILGAFFFTFSYFKDKLHNFLARFKMQYFTIFEFKIAKWCFFNYETHFWLTTLLSYVVSYLTVKFYCSNPNSSDFTQDNSNSSIVCILIGHVLYINIQVHILKVYWNYSQNKTNYA